MHLRNGAHRWGLHEDLNRSNTFRLEMMISSWNDYLLQLARITKAEQEVIEKEVLQRFDSAENFQFCRKPPCLSASKSRANFSTKSRKRGIFRQN